MLKMLVKLFFYDACLDAFFDRVIVALHVDEEREKLLRNLHEKFNRHYAMVMGFELSIEQIRTIYSRELINKIREDIAEVDEDIREEKWAFL